MSHEWKAIADEMPPEGERVLCYGKSLLYEHDTMAVMYWDDVGSGPYWNVACVSGHEWDVDLVPTHWTRLPVLNKGSEQW